MIALIYLFLVSPRVTNPPDTELISCDYAHRGLWNSRYAENSLSAFENAARNGYGIELDIQLTKDKRIVVFHDDDLKRMCGVNTRVCELTLSELRTLRLGNTQEMIPTFAEALKLIGGRVPLIIEIKADSALYKEITQKTLALLKEYKGEFVIESFHPVVLKMVQKADKRICRGQLCAWYSVKGKRLPFYFYVARLFLFNVVSRPHFIAYNFKIQNKFMFRLMRFLYPKCHFVAWTPSSDAHDAACQGFDALIFENYTPAQAPYGRLIK